MLNRAVGRATIFDAAANYVAFEHLLEAGCEAVPVRLLESRLIPNH